MLNKFKLARIDVRSPAGRIDAVNAGPTVEDIRRVAVERRERITVALESGDEVAHLALERGIQTHGNRQVGNDALPTQRGKKQRIGIEREIAVVVAVHAVMNEPR